MKFSFKSFAILLVVMLAVGLGIVYIMIQAQAGPKAEVKTKVTAEAMLKNLKDNIGDVTAMAVEKCIPYQGKNHPKDGYPNSDHTGWNTRVELDADDQKKIVDVLGKIGSMNEMPEERKLPGFALVLSVKRKGPRGGGMLPPPTSIAVYFEQLPDADRDAVNKIVNEKHADFMKI